MSTKPYRPCIRCRKNAPPDRLEGQYPCTACRVDWKAWTEATEAADAFRVRLAARSE